MIKGIADSIKSFQDSYNDFAAVLFTEKDAHLVKILKDCEYYTSLDEISGEALPILISMLFQGQHRYPKIPPGVMACIVPIWEEPRENIKVIENLKINDSSGLPVFILFSKRGTSFAHLVIPIDSGNLEETYSSLKDIIETVVQIIPKCADSDIDYFHNLILSAMKKPWSRYRTTAAQYSINEAHITCETIQNLSSEVIKMSKTEVNLGEGATIHGNIIIAKSIENSFNKAVNSRANEELKGHLQNLAKCIGELQVSMNAVTAETTAKDLDALTSEAVSSNPREKWWKLSSEGLKDALLSLGTIATPAIEIINKISDILAQNR